MVAPVCGLRPVRAARCVRSTASHPGMETLVPRTDGLGERVEETAEHGVDGGLALAGRRSDLRDELGLVQRLVSH